MSEVCDNETMCESDVGIPVAEAAMSDVARGAPVCCCVVLVSVN